MSNSYPFDEILVFEFLDGLLLADSSLPVKTLRSRMPHDVVNSGQRHQVFLENKETRTHLEPSPWAPSVMLKCPLLKMKKIKILKKISLNLTFYLKSVKFDISRLLYLIKYQTDFKM